MSRVRPDDNPLRQRGDTHGFASYSDRIDDVFPTRVDAEFARWSEAVRRSYGTRGHRHDVNIADYARTLVEEYKIGGGTIEPREFTSPRDIATLPQRLVVNCTGYGVRKLWSDETPIPIRGQIGWLPTQEGVNYGMALDDLIITGRRGGIAVQPTPQGDDTGWNDESEIPDRDAAKAGVIALARFYAATDPKAP